jgi:hypothetical protein
MQDPVTKAELYRKAANKYGEMAKQAEADYVAEIYRKVAMRYVFHGRGLAELVRATTGGRRKRPRRSFSRSAGRLVGVLR